VFKTFLKDKEKIVNALQLPYSNAKLEATNNLIKLIKRNSFGSLLFDVQSDEDSSFKFFKVSISLDDLNEVIIVN
ncbi:transposase, partial [Streptococcus pneumoniae]